MIFYPPKPCIHLIIQSTFQVYQDEKFICHTKEYYNIHINGNKNDLKAFSFEIVLTEGCPKNLQKRKDTFDFLLQNFSSILYLHFWTPNVNVCLFCCGLSFESRFSLKSKIGSTLLIKAFSIKKGLTLYESPVKYGTRRKITQILKNTFLIVCLENKSSWYCLV